MHRYTTGLHWSRGVLLHDPDPEAPAWALLEDDGADQPTVTIRVRGCHPVRFLSVLWEAFRNIIEQRYTGLIDAVLVPCSCNDPADTPCPHRYTLKNLLNVASDDDPDASRKVYCDDSGRKVDARALLDGLPESRLVERLDTVHDDMTRTTTRILDAVRDLGRQRAQGGIHCPSLFEISEDPSRMPGIHKIRIALWCEWPYSGDPSNSLPGGPHRLPHDVGVYRLRKLPDGVRLYLPYLKVLSAALGIAVPMITPSLFAATREASEQAIGLLETTDKFLDAIPEPHRGPETPHPRRTPPGTPRSMADTPADFRTLRAALQEIDPKMKWGGLSHVTRPEDQNSVIYVCPQHYQQLKHPYQP